MSKFCMNCGADNADTARFCKSCGSDNFRDPNDITPDTDSTAKEKENEQDDVEPGVYTGGYIPDIPVDPEKDPIDPPEDPADPPENPADLSEDPVDPSKTPDELPKEKNNLKAVIAIIVLAVLIVIAGIILIFLLINNNKYKPEDGYEPIENVQYDDEEIEDDEDRILINDDADFSTPAGILAYYKAAYAKASSAKKIVKYYDNTVNYNYHLDVRDNSTLAGVAKTLMNTFMKEDTTEHEFDGAEGAKTLPPDGGSVDGLTLDMLRTPTCEEKNGKYIITLQINSDENNYDTGDKTKHLTNTVDEKTVTDAAGSMVSLSGLENRYFGAKVIATVDKKTGNLENLETYIPSYMCFSEAVVLVVKENNVSIGIEYRQKWRLEY